MKQRIKPNYEGEEPMCSDKSGDCPRFPRNLEGFLDRKSHCWGCDGSCIPGIKRDRDKYKQALEEDHKILSNGETAQKTKG